jgi:hypothetical protein
MTLDTVLRKPARLMIGIAGVREIGAMTINTVRREPGELVVHMTIIASYGTMCTSKRKWRRIMRECRRLPGRRSMTRLACRGKLGDGVIRVRGSLKINTVARDAFHRRVFENLSCMTRDARHGFVRSD